MKTIRPPWDEPNPPRTAPAGRTDVTDTPRIPERRVGTDPETGEPITEPDPKAIARAVAGPEE